VDTTISYGKVTPYIDKTVDFSRRADGAAVLALDADGWDHAPKTTVEGLLTVFGAPLLVRPGESRTVRLVYTDPVPASATLKLFHQPGAPELRVGPAR
jgi:hypothetical protein